MINSKAIQSHKVVVVVVVGMKDVCQSVNNNRKQSLDKFLTIFSSFRIYTSKNQIKKKKTESIYRSINSTPIHPLSLLRACFALQILPNCLDLFTQAKDEKIKKSKGNFCCLIESTTTTIREDVVWGVVMVVAM